MLAPLLLWEEPVNRGRLHGMIASRDAMQHFLGMVTNSTYRSYLSRETRFSSGVSSAINFLRPFGEHFVIGQTTFTLLDQLVEISVQAGPVFAEQTFSAHLLRQSKYRDADRRIEVLGKLPEIIAGSNSDEELCVRIVNVLLLGITQASFVCYIAYS